MTTYRAYSKDEVIEIYQKETPDFPGINLTPRKCMVATYPAGNKDNNVPPGMYLLHKLPSSSTTVNPCPLISNSKELLDEVVMDIKNTFGKFQKDVVEAWQSWVDLFAPKTNDVSDYIQR